MTLSTDCSSADFSPPPHLPGEILRQLPSLEFVQLHPVPRPRTQAAGAVELLRGAARLVLDVAEESAREDVEEGASGELPQAALEGSAGRRRGVIIRFCRKD